MPSFSRPCYGQSEDEEREWLASPETPMKMGRCCHMAEIVATILLSFVKRTRSSALKAGLLYAVLSSLSVCAQIRPGGGGITTGGGGLSDREFYIHDLGHRCIDVGAPTSWAVGSPVYIYSCNGTAAQRIRVTEIDSSHDVHLGVRTTLASTPAPAAGPVGLNSAFCIGVRGGQASLDQPLELQVCDANSPAQRFAVDGDAILVGTQTTGRVTRDFVIAPRSRFTLSRTPLVVSVQESSDAEYFRFEAVDHSSAPPTSGFFTVANEAALDDALALGWGTVIELDPAQPIELKGPFPKKIHAGTTLRGYRRYTDNGPEVHVCTAIAEDTDPKDYHHNYTAIPSFVIAEDNVRVTGFRLRGLLTDARCPASTQPFIFVAGGTDFRNPDDALEGDAIDIILQPPQPGVSSSSATGHGRSTPRAAINPGWTGGTQRVFIDHMEISYWTGAAIATFGLEQGDTNTSCPSPAPSYPQTTPVRVVRNFLHDNLWYGSVAYYGAFVHNQGNTFANLNNHSISSDGYAVAGYNAYDNLFQNSEGYHRGDHDIDMHGSCDVQGGHWLGGISGDYFDVGWNTILRLDAGCNPTSDAKCSQRNLTQRGTPCRFLAIHDNVFRQRRCDAISSVYLPECAETDPPKPCTSVDQMKLPVIYADEFAATDPMVDSANPLSVGDFDGDGHDDVFVGTGAGWYVSSGARGEWRFLNRMPEKTSALLFGDFDGDGRTDVLALHGANLDVSWGGISPWQTINVVAWPVSNMAIGDFDGDGTSDLFLATGSQWFFAPGGKDWKLIGSFTDTRDQLLFGDFLHQGFTQMLRIHQGNWEIASLKQGWTVIGPAPVNSVAGLVVGKFDSDGVAEVARSNSGSGQWEYTSPPRNTTWKSLRADSSQLSGHPVGRFLGSLNTDIVVWQGSVFYVAPAGREPLQRISRQDMR